MNEPGFHERTKVVTSGYDSNGISVYYNTARPNPIHHRAQIPRLRMGTLDDLAVSKDTFAFRGDHGLKEYIRTSFTEREIPTYIFDTHNHAFFAWCEALKERKILTGATLIHIDTHADELQPSNTIVDISHLLSVHDYTQRLRIDNFIAPALTHGLISRVFWISPFQTGEKLVEEGGEDGSITYSLTGLAEPSLAAVLEDSRQVIVDVDLDYFEPIISNYEHLQLTRRSNNPHQELLEHDVEKIRNIMKQAGVITMATSPSHIDQKVALTLATKLLKT